LDLPPDHSAAVIDPHKPLLIVDVDEVLALFMRGFGRFVAAFGYELRLDRFAIFENIYETGGAEPVATSAGRALFDDFFRSGCEDIDPTPHAAESLRRLSERASVVVLTNAPEHGRSGRGRWLVRHGMDYPLIINSGPKGAAVAALAARTSGPAAFVDDLLYQLDSAADAAPAVRRFQLVADPRLRPMAPSAPERHRRIDEWPELTAEIEAALGLEPR
jgi:hypothetical protein